MSYSGNLLSAVFWASSKGYIVRRKKDRGRMRLFVVDSSSLDMLQDLDLSGNVYLITSFNLKVNVSVTV